MCSESFPGCSCHAAQTSKGNFQKTFCKNFYSTCRPRLYILSSPSLPPSPDPDSIRVKRLRSENRPPDPKVMNAKLARQGSELDFDFGSALNAK